MVKKEAGKMDGKPSALTISAAIRKCKRLKAEQLITLLSGYIDPSRKNSGMVQAILKELLVRLN